MGQKKILLLLELADTYGRDLARGISLYSRINGPWHFYRLPPWYFRPQKHTKRLHIPASEKKTADGIIAHVNNPDDAEEIISSGIPSIVTFVFDPVPGIINICSNDNKLGVMAAQHFLEKNYKHFAFCGFDDMVWSNSRKESFSKAIEEASFHCDVFSQSILGKHISGGHRQNQLCKWLQSLPTPSGLFSCNDARAQDVLEACKICDIKVPDQIAVLGVDNDDAICNLCNPPLSSIPQNTHQAGYEAGALLDNMMSGHNPDRDSIIVNPEPIVTRESTRLLVFSDEFVNKAINFIQQNAGHIICVDEVAEAVNLSLRQLQRKFKRTVGISIVEQIRKVRMQKAADLLVSTDLPIYLIAEKVGYLSPKNIARSFRKETGITMMEYRKINGKIGPDNM